MSKALGNTKQLETVCTGPLPEEPMHGHKPFSHQLGLEIKIKNALPRMESQKTEKPLPVRSEGTRYFLLSRSGTLALGAFSTMT